MDVILLAGTHMAGCTGLRKQILASRDALTASGIHVPSTYGDHAATWHNLAWELGEDRRFVERRGTIDNALDEAKRANSKALLLMSEEFETVAMDPDASARITGLGERSEGAVRVRLLFRHQLSYLNLVFAFRAVNGLHATWFEDFVRSPVPPEQFDYHDVVARFRQDPGADARPLSLKDAVDAGGLAWVIQSAGYSVKRLPSRKLETEGPPTSMRVLASLMAHRVLTGRDQEVNEVNRPRIKQLAGDLALRFPQAGQYWGWTQALLDEWMPGFTSANERFAQYHGVALEPDSKPKNATEAHIREADPSLIKDLVEGLNRISKGDLEPPAEDS
jgi:hypothetical protein